MMIRERILIELRRLEEENTEIRRMLPEMPEGQLQCRKNGNTYKWFRKIPGMRESPFDMNVS